MQSRSSVSIHIHTPMHSYLCVYGCTHIQCTHTYTPIHKHRHKQTNANACHGRLAYPLTMPILPCGQHFDICKPKCGEVINHKILVFPHIISIYGQLHYRSQSQQVLMRGCYPTKDVLLMPVQLVEPIPLKVWELGSPHPSCTHLACSALWATLFMFTYPVGYHDHKCHLKSFPQSMCEH